MNENIQQFFLTKNLFSHSNEGITVCTVEDKEQGLDIAKELLYGVVDKRTALYLSGGSTPKPMYEGFAKDEKLRPGVVGLIDERYGDPMHEGSNERMIGQTGLLGYLSLLDLPWYGMLRGVPIEKTAERYDELVRSLQTVYPRSVGILGIGADGHTAGIAPNRVDFQNPLFSKTPHPNLLPMGEGESSPLPQGRGQGEGDFAMVSWFDDAQGSFKKRVTMTFLGLSMLDLMIVLVFGEDKKRALQQMFTDGKEEDIPARFFKRKDIAPKTLLITDRKV